MGPVSVYRVGGVGADPSHLFGGEARDRDLLHAAWLGWLPLTLVEFAGPGIAVVGDAWLTALSGRSESPRRAVVGDVVTALDAVGELFARRESGLTAFTHCPVHLPSSEPLWASSIGMSIADDLVAHVDRVRTAHVALVESVDEVEQERAVLDACQSLPSGDSPVRRRYGRAMRDLQEEQLRLHLLLEAVARIEVFDPAVGRR